MAGLREHARLPVFADGVYLQEVTSVTFKTESGQQRVETLEGLAGFTPGSGTCTVSIETAIPIGGEEFPFQKKSVDGELVTFQIGVGAKAYAGSGKIIDVEISQSTGAAASETVNWEGQFVALQ